MKGLRFDPVKHEYFWKGKKVPGFSQIATAEGLQDKRYYSKESAERGKTIHLITELYDRGMLDEASVDPRLAGWFNAYKKFLVDHKDRLKILRIEEPVYCEQYGYGTTPDRIAVLDHYGCLYDIKTGGPEDWHPFQLWAGALCFEKIAGQDVYDIEKLYDLYLRKTGTYAFIPVTDRAARNVWISATLLYNWKMRRKR